MQGRKEGAQRWRIGPGGRHQDGAGGGGGRLDEGLRAAAGPGGRRRLAAPRGTHGGGRVARAGPGQRRARGPRGWSVGARVGVAGVVDQELERPRRPRGHWPRLAWRVAPVRGRPLSLAPRCSVDHGSPGGINQLLRIGTGRQGSQNFDFFFAFSFGWWHYAVCVERRGLMRNRPLPKQDDPYRVHASC